MRREGTMKIGKAETERALVSVQTVEDADAALLRLSNEIMDSEECRHNDNGCYFLAPRCLNTMITIMRVSLQDSIYLYRASRRKVDCTASLCADTTMLSKTASRNFTRKYADAFDKMSALWNKQKHLCRRAIRATSHMSSRDRRIALWLTGIYGGVISLPDIDADTVAKDIERNGRNSQLNVMMARSRIASAFPGAVSCQPSPFKRQGNETPAIFMTSEFKALIGRNKTESFYKTLAKLAKMSIETGLPQLAARTTSGDHLTPYSLCYVMHAAGRSHYNFMAYMAALRHYSKNSAKAATAKGVENTLHHSQHRVISKDRLKALTDVYLSRKAYTYFSSIASKVKALRLPEKSFGGSQFSDRWSLKQDAFTIIDERLRDMCMDETSSMERACRNGKALLEALSLAQKVLIVHNAYARSMENGSDGQRARHSIRGVQRIFEKVTRDLKREMKFCPRDRRLYSIMDGLSAD